MEVYTGSGNVFADLGLPDAEEQLAKAKLAAAVRQLIGARGLDRTTLRSPLTAQPFRAVLGMV